MVYDAAVQRQGEARSHNARVMPRNQRTISGACLVGCSGGSSSADLSSPFCRRRVLGWRLGAVLRGFFSPSLVALPGLCLRIRPEGLARAWCRTTVRGDAQVPFHCVSLAPSRGSHGVGPPGPMSNFHMSGWPVWRGRVGGPAVTTKRTASRINQICGELLRGPSGGARQGFVVITAFVATRFRCTITVRDFGG